jgi:hypothetical protein
MARPAGQYPESPRIVAGKYALPENRHINALKEQKLELSRKREINFE